MVQVEALFRSRLIPQNMQKCLLSSISITSTHQKPSVSVYPNLSRGFSDSIFLFLSKMIGARRLLIKLFEIFVSGFIPPEHEPSLPSQLMGEALDVALREHELDKRERLLHLRALQIGATGHHKQTHLGQGTQVPVNQTTLQRVSSFMRPTAIGPRSSWRWTIMSDIDSEDDTVDVLHPTVRTQNSIRASHPVAPQRTIIPDPNARLEELKNMVLSLQASVEAMTAAVQQQDIRRLPSQITTGISTGQGPSASNSTHEISF